MTLEIVLVTIILSVLVIVLLIGFFWYIREANRQIVNLTRAVIAKSLNEFDEKPKVTELPKKEDTQSEFIPVENLDEDIFNKMIENQLNG